MKTILVTGASSGIGEVTARQLLAEGHRVYVAARRMDRMAELAAAGAIPLAMDITKDADVKRVAAHIDKEAGGVDVLVNNAGFGMFGAIEDTPIDEARYQFEVNLFGLANLTQQLLPGMRAKGAGTIVNISSMAGKVYTPLGGWYHATKHALEGWSDCLRFELAPHGIDVVIIEPGIIKTAFDDVMVEPMLKRSGSGAYAPMAKRLATSTAKNYGSKHASKPELIARTISRAIRARRPKTRYAVGRLAKPSIWLRKWGGDRVFDRVLRGSV